MATVMYQPPRRPLLAGMRRTAATIALAVIAAIGLTAPAHAIGIGVYHPTRAGCPSILEYRTIYVAQPPVHVVQITQERTKVSCYDALPAYTPWVNVSYAPGHP